MVFKVNYVTTYLSYVVNKKVSDFSEKQTLPMLSIWSAELFKIKGQVEINDNYEVKCHLCNKNRS